MMDVLEIAGVFHLDIAALLVKLREPVEEVDTLLCVRRDRVILIL